MKCVRDASTAFPAAKKVYLLYIDIGNSRPWAFDIYIGPKCLEASSTSLIQRPMFKTKIFYRTQIC